MVRWYKRDWFEYDAVKDNGADIQALREALESAVKRQLMSDVPYGVLLSGGLDSSIISAVAKKYADRRVESNDRDRAWWPQLHSFAIGLKGAPTWRRHARSPTISAPYTTKSTTPYRRGWMPCAT